MGRRREPIALIEAKGRKHLTKAEIEARKAQEPDAPDDDLVAPAYLTGKQTNKFNKIVYEMKRIGTIANADVDTVAKYVILHEEFEKLTAILDMISPVDDFDQYEKLSKHRIRVFNAASQAARDLGLPVSSRCKLVMPKLPEEKPENRFLKKFGAGG